MNKDNFNIWWGPPKKFSFTKNERRVSWLELFYDLVYVIVISRATHLLAEHPTFLGFIDYAYSFAMIYWGWYNGSMHHDLHGSTGIRTRFMTLWQIMIVAALGVTLTSVDTALALQRNTFLLILLQIFITYLWWSVGVYDKRHRKLNTPYTVCFLTSLLLLVATFFIPQPYKRVLFWIALFLNFLPPFLLMKRNETIRQNLTISPSMMERFGLLTIIVFGEYIVSIVNGIAVTEEYTFLLWFYFAIGISIVFALWWIFFSLVADRESKPGFMNGEYITLLYLPTLSSLGTSAALILQLFSHINDPQGHEQSTLLWFFAVSTGVFLLSITALTQFLEYPSKQENEKNFFKKS